MINQINLNSLLILDIETVAGTPDYQLLSEDWRTLWLGKVSKTMPENISADEFYLQRAGILAEFGKIICISTSVFYYQDEKLLCRIKSFNAKNEKELLQNFSSMLQIFKQKRGTVLFAGHNIKEFDIPYICRRMMVNDVPLPDMLQLYGKKPWETNLIDTLELWRFGDYKNYTSLNLLASVLGIPTPKDDIDGSQVGEVYYKENDIARITTYCQKDVLTVANVLLKFRHLPTLLENQIEIATPESGTV